MGELRRGPGVALPFVAYDLAVVRQAGDRVVVMRRGRVVEEGPVVQGCESPRDPCIRQLLAAVPALDPEAAAGRRAKRGELPAA